MKRLDNRNSNYMYVGPVRNSKTPSLTQQMRGFELLAQEATLLDYLHEVEHMAARVERPDRAIEEAVKLAPPLMCEVMIIGTLCATLQRLSNEFRCVASDYIGFGLSDKPYNPFIGGSRGRSSSSTAGHGKRYTSRSSAQR